MKVFWLFIGVVLFACGVKMIYDARLIVKNYFSVKNENSAVIIMKVFGTIFAFVRMCSCFKKFGFLGRRTYEINL